MAMNQAIDFLNSQPDYTSSQYSLIVRQQPNKARLCSFKEKVDRRPIDPPPIIELSSNLSNDDFLQNPYFFLCATLMDASGEVDLHLINGNKTTAGVVVQSLHRLKDLDNVDGGFFIFSDISVRLEGIYRLKFTLFGIENDTVNRLCYTLSDTFQVYSPKSFPGMSESTFLTRCFSDQGVRIRIRKEPRSTRINNNGKRFRGNTNESDEDDASSIHDLDPHNRVSSIFNPSPLVSGTHIPRDYISRPTLPSPEQLFKSSAMSMQNILSNDRDQLYHISPLDEENNSNLLASRKLPLPACYKVPKQQENCSRKHDINVLLNQQALAWSSKDRFSL